MRFQFLLPKSLTLFLSSQISAISTITITATSPPAPTSTSYTSDSAFKSLILSAHNFYRLEHNVSSLAWNTTSASYAQEWSSNCLFKHSGGPTGENLAAGYVNASQSVDAWGLEREEYDWSKPGFSEKTGHFTQLVWSNTTSVGCARTACEGKGDTPGYYVVCEYFPAGNVVGDKNEYFKDNVKRQIKGKNSDTVESGVTSLGRGWENLRWGIGVLLLAGILGLGMVW